MNSFPNQTSTPQEVRELFRTGEIVRPTTGLCDNYLQANLVILPEKLAFNFLLFCQRNPKPCPVLDVTDVGSSEPKIVAPGADLRTDLPLYRIFKNGELVEEVTDLLNYWQDDFVAFLLGCSFSFEAPMIAANLPVRHIEEGRNVPMYITNIPCEPAENFAGNLVVSMRPLTPIQAIQAVEITSKFSNAHGAPIHFGSPETIGISDINQPDFGDTVSINDDEVPVFWACGVTPQVAIRNSGVEFAITHSPGHMFITDIKAN
ncbi:putative hydro-lyase [Crocosphaera sp.]|uniref:putative hydro-lyase n=1 Tax=Crocosphaera sp. TaxID=2729996 RepID=UPI0026035962|nr:putative hydro-lyase [Crocosphaera sp.]MDJ0578419.1 putative hydro-lyase [Crocosphaera sp.]